MAKEGYSLSKSTFIRGQQCQKSLYLHKNRPFLRDRLSPEQLAKFRRGHDVGKLAWQLFPGGISCAAAHPTQYRASLEKTRSLVEANTPVIYEAAFLHDGVLVFLDILTKDEAGWHAFEVKSSLSVSDTYITDAALQHYVIEGSGLKLSSFSIIRMNPDYIRQGEPDVIGLFEPVDVTEKVAGMHAFIAGQIILSKETLALKHSPPIPVGIQCYNPYPCDFIGHCWKNTGKDSVYFVYGIPFERRDALVKAGYTAVSDIPEGVGQESEVAIFSAYLSGNDLINEEKIRVVAGNPGQAAFVAFLIIRPAIPLFDGFRPFEPVIAGMAWITEDGSKGEFLVRPGENPTEKIREQLGKLLSENGRIFHAGGLSATTALNTTYAGIVKQYPIADLSELFREKYFYRPGLNPEAEIGEIAAFLKLKNRAKSHLSAIMQGVTYLEDDKNENEEPLDRVKQSLHDDALSCKSVYDFLIKTINQN